MYNKGRGDKEIPEQPLFSVVKHVKLHGELNSVVKFDVLHHLKIKLKALQMNDEHSRQLRNAASF